MKMTTAMLGLAAMLAMFGLCPPLRAQFATPTINANVDAVPSVYQQYHVDKETPNRYYYITWDDTYLYLFLENVRQDHYMTCFFDFNPVFPVNGGSDSDGSLTGATFGGVTPTLPFRADAAVYVKNSYREIKKADGSGGWNTFASGNGALSGTSDDYADGSLSVTDNGNGTGDDDRRECRIPWSRLTGSGRPSSFNFFAYANDEGTGATYSRLPQENTTTSTFNYYFQIDNTGDGSSTAPFSQNCYTHYASGTVSGFKGLSIFNFTMNAPSGAILSREPNGTGNDWAIVGSLYVAANNTIYFGSSGGSGYGSTSVQGSVTINGEIDMDYTTQAFNIDQNLTVGSGGKLRLSRQSGGDLRVGGDFTDNSTLFEGNERAVFFDGSAAQTLSGSSTTVIDYLFMQNTGAGLTVSNQLEVDNELYLTDGIVNTASASNLIMLADATLGAGAEGSDASHINGPMRKYYNANEGFTFPVGKNGKIRTAGVNTTSGSADTYFDVEYFKGNPYDNTQFDAPIVRVSIVEHWIIDRGAGGDRGGTVTLSWDAESGVQSPTTLLVARWNGSKWQSQCTCDYTDVVNDKITSGAIASFSPYTLASSDDNNTLPVELVDFRAERAGPRIARVFWNTAAEVDNDHFIVERSIDGVNFHALGKVEGAGTTALPQRYEFFDHEAHLGRNYYRLRIVSAGGAYEYSQLASVDFTGNGLEIAVAPNPTPDVVKIYVYSPNGSQYTLELFDMAGKQVMQQALQIEAGSWSPPIDVRSLAQGVYALRVFDGRHYRIERLIKE